MDSPVPAFLLIWLLIILVEASGVSGSGSSFKYIYSAVSSLLDSVLVVFPPDVISNLFMKTRVWLARPDVVAILPSTVNSYSPLSGTASDVN